MERLGKKLRSESGASILLALLMFLICTLVGATVLAAAVSNAGKARSNRTEQQKFLNLSSAIQLVADEIRQAKYTGKYQVYEWDVITKTTTTNLADHTTTTTSETEYFFCCEQLKGEYTCGDLTDQLPFGPKLDEIFGKQFTGEGFKPLSVPTSPPGQYDLLVTLEGTFPSDSAPKGYEVPKQVTVQVKLDENTHHILLTAWEGTGECPAKETGEPDLSKTMQAELVAKAGTAPVPGYSPGARTALSSKPAGGTNETTTDGVRVTKTVEVAERVIEEETAAGAPMQWELHWLRKGAVTS